MKTKKSWLHFFEASMMAAVHLCYASSNMTLCVSMCVYMCVMGRMLRGEEEHHLNLTRPEQQNPTDLICVRNNVSLGCQASRQET